MEFESCKPRRVPEVYVEPTMTDEQQAVADEIVKLVGTSDTECLSAPAGCGKSFTIAQAFKNFNCLFLTPTHASKSIIEQSLPAGHNHDVRTIHSAVGWACHRPTPLSPVKEWIKEVTDRRNKEMWEAADIVVLDEASMTTKSLFDALHQYTWLHSLPLLLVGDQHQLPAIHQQINVFDMGFKVHTLKTNMRFSDDSGIAMLANSIRNRIEKKKFALAKVADKPEWKDVNLYPNKQWLEMIAEAYHNDEDFVVIAFDHDSLQRIRHYLIGQSYGFQTGHMIRCLDGTSDFRNGEVLEITYAAEPEEEISYYDLKKYYTSKPAWVPTSIWELGLLILTFQRIEFANGKVTHIIADEFTKKAIKNLPKQLKRYDVKMKVRNFTKWDLSVLKTCHSSQGSSYDKAFLHHTVLVKTGHWKQRDRRIQEEFMRLLYVAVTRARKELIIQDYNGDA